MPLFEPLHQGSLAPFTWDVKAIAFIENYEPNYPLSLVLHLFKSTDFSVVILIYTRMKESLIFLCCVEPLIMALL